LSRLSDLKAATNLVEFAPILGLPPSALAYTLYVAPGPKYTTFTIPKKLGGVRSIAAPTARLKDVQRYLADLLTDCRHEIESAEKPPKKLISHAFRTEGSIITNARQHRKRRYVLNLDLEGFFPSINFGRVRGYFMGNKSFALHERVATVIAQIACHDNSLPQGSPCSPIISDLIGHLLDVRLAALAKKNKCSYSRYADDLTFSTNRKEFPCSLAYQLAPDSSAWILGDDLLEAVNRAGFSINHQKTRMQYLNSRQVVTGLTVNAKANIRADYYRTTRSMCHSLFTTGTYVKPGKPGNTNVSPGPGNMLALEGMLNHIYFVKKQEDVRTESAPSYADRHGIERLYGRFLFYKKFVACEKPILIAEGKTDNIYLRAAIKYLPAYHPVLRTTHGGITSNNITFFKHSHITRETLGLDGSSSYFGNFVLGYKEVAAKFKHAPFEHPVIILIDNDDGAKGIFSVLRNMKINIDRTTTAPFYHIVRNLYLVKTPESPAPKFSSQIEELFAATALGTVLNGKTFNMKNDTDTASEYGKAYFADYVVAPHAHTINFAGFAPLLDRITAAIAYHDTLVAAGAV
jgi:RNA-directed DNA polymerase